MEYNRTRHFILKELYKKYELNKDVENIKADSIGLSFKEIDLLLKKKNKYRDLILSELVKSEEIVLFILDERGYNIDFKKGFIALSSKKYTKKNEDIIIKWSKYFVQIILPIASIIIAFLALTLRFNYMSNNIEKKVSKSYNIELQNLQMQIDSIKQLENK